MFGYSILVKCLRVLDGFFFKVLLLLFLKVEKCLETNKDKMNKYIIERRGKGCEFIDNLIKKK